MPFRISNVCAKALADSFDGLINDTFGSIIMGIRTGAQPADPDTAATGILLTSFALPNPLFGDATDGSPGGVITSNAITDAFIAATGTAEWFRISSDGDICDGSIDTSNADFIVNTTSFTSGSDLQTISIQIVFPEG